MTIDEAEPLNHAEWCEMLEHTFAMRDRRVEWKWHLLIDYAPTPLDLRRYTVVPSLPAQMWVQEAVQEANPLFMEGLAELYRRTGHPSLLPGHPASPDDPELIDWIKRGFDSFHHETLVLLQEKLPAPNPAALRKLKEQRKADRLPPPPLQDFEFEVYDQDKLGYGHIPATFVDSEDRTLNRRLDPNGYSFLIQMQPGTCQVKVPAPEPFAPLEEEQVLNLTLRYEDGSLPPQTPYIITLQDGSTVTGTLSSMGTTTARWCGSPSCRIGFPEFKTTTAELTAGKDIEAGKPVRLMAAPPPPLETTFALEVYRYAASQLTEVGFVHWTHIMFGGDIPTQAAKDLFADLPNLEHPKTSFVEDKPGGHLASYDKRSASIALHQSLLDVILDGKAEGVQLAAILLEEFGHYIDDLLRNQYSSIGGDASGDEGRLLASVLFAIQWQEEPSATVGTYEAREIKVDWAALRNGSSTGNANADGLDIDADVDADEQSENLEFHGSLDTQAGDDSEPLYPSFAAYAQDSQEARTIESYFQFITEMPVYGIVEVARKLARRLDGQPSGLYLRGSGPLDPRARVTVLQTLKTMYQALEQRFVKAPLGPDGLPEFSDDELGEKTDDDTVLFTPGSPLAGIVGDISPFGNLDSWVAELNTINLPPIPKRPPRDTSNDLVWEPPEPEPKSPPFDPMAAAYEMPINVGHTASHLGDTARGAKARSFDSDNRTLTILDALWTSLSELVSGPAMEAAGPIGSIILAYWSYYKTLSEVAARAAQDGLLSGLEIGLRGIDSVATKKADLVVSARNVNRSTILGFISSDPKLRLLWDGRRLPPMAHYRIVHSEHGLDALAVGLSRALAATEHAASMRYDLESLSKQDREKYLHAIRVRTHYAFARAGRAQMKEAMAKVPPR